MPIAKKSSLSGPKGGRSAVSDWFPLRESVAKTLDATSHLSVFCSWGNHEDDPRLPIQESFKKALIRRGVSCLTNVIPVTPEMALSRIYIYVPIGNTKKNEYWNYLYRTRDEVCSFIMTLEERMLALKLAKIPPTEYSPPLASDRWNVLLAIHPTLSGHWKTAERRAITGEGVNILEENSMMLDHIGYKLAAAEVSKANLRSKTKAGWVSATGTDRNHQHGKPYNLARPIHTIHNKSSAVRSDAQFAKAWAREFTRSYRSPSVESGHYYADRLSSARGTLRLRRSSVDTPDLVPKVKEEPVDLVPHSTSTSLPTQDNTKDAEVAIKSDSSAKAPIVPVDHTEPSEAESTGEETLVEADLTDSEEIDDLAIVSSASKDENTDLHSEEELAINGPAADTNDTPASPATTNPATPTPTFAPFTPLALDPVLFEEANEDDFPPRVVIDHKKQLDRDAKIWLAKHGKKNAKPWIH